MKYQILNNGVRMPALGIGTFLFSPAEAEKSVDTALRNGYELVDTANGYLNEKGVGRGMRDSGKKREDIFLVTKLWPSIYGEADQAIDATLKRLGVEYIDLLLLHQPAGEYMEGYKAMERAVKAGKVRAIGLSNFDEFNLPKMEAILDRCEIRPAVVQVEAHPYYQQNELMAKLDSFGAKIMAWYPLGHGDTALREERVFTELGEKYGKTPTQIILRWHTQAGHIVIPGSRNEAHICSNIDIFGFSLTDEEMAQIAQMDKGVRYYRASEEALANYAAYNPDFDAQL